MKSVNKFQLLIGTMLMIAGLSGGCKKFVEVGGPVTSLSSANVYSNDATAAAVLTGIYGNMSQYAISGNPQGLLSTSFFLGLSADELDLYAASSNTGARAYYQNALTNINPGASDCWSTVYPVIGIANSAIEGLAAGSGLTPAVRQQLTGEAKFMRAFCYFYLVNLYGDVPLVTGTNYKVNALLPRAPAAQVYQQIVADLTDAQQLLSDRYLDATLLNSSAERVRPTKWAAAALLARTYLYMGDWKNAELSASAVIGNSAMFGLSTLDKVFLKASLGNNEAIWQLQPVTFGQNTQEAQTFILPLSGPNDGNNPVYLSTGLLNSFVPGDQRYANWVNSVTDTVGNVPVTYYYAYKYKVNALNADVTEYEMVLRLAEQYLIRAEAEAQLGESGAVSDLNTIRNRAGLPAYSGATDKASLLTAILNERQVELFTEWGHRWLDLKRTHTVDAVMTGVTPQKQGTWNSAHQLFPVCLYELQNDPKLVQNPGY